MELRFSTMSEPQSRFLSSRRMKEAHEKIAVKRNWDKSIHTARHSANEERAFARILRYTTCPAYAFESKNDSSTVRLFERHLNPDKVISTIGRRRQLPH